MVLPRVGLSPRSRGSCRPAWRRPGRAGRRAPAGSWGRGCGRRGRAGLRRSWRRMLSPYQVPSCSAKCSILRGRRSGFPQVQTTRTSPATHAASSTAPASSVLTRSALPSDLHAVRVERLPAVDHRQDRHRHQRVQGSPPRRDAGVRPPLLRIRSGDAGHGVGQRDGAGRRARPRRCVVSSPRATRRGPPGSATRRAAAAASRSPPPAAGRSPTRPRGGGRTRPAR